MKNAHGLTAAGLFFLVFFVVARTLPAGEIPAEKFSLKISAGYGTAGFGDLNKAEEGHNARFEDLARLWGFAKTGEIALPHEGLDVSAEIVLGIAPRLDVGLGSGFLSRMSRESEVAIRQDSTGALSLQRWTASASATPLTLNVYYRIPLSSRLSGLLKAGLGCYFANFKLRSFRQSELLGVQTWSQTISRGRDYALGFQAGLVLEYGISRAFSCFTEGTWRFVNFKNWSIEYAYSSVFVNDAPRTASCWSAEELNRDTGKVYPTFFYSDQAIESANDRNVRKAWIDFSGWCIQAGFRLQLGKR